jgi:hypothetical protein
MITIIAEETGTAQDRATGEQPNPLRRPAVRHVARTVRRQGQVGPEGRVARWQQGGSGS